MEITKDLIAASCTPLILTILKDGDDYGYNIIKKIALVTDGELKWKEGSLYPVLAKLEKREYLSSYFQVQDGRKRKYYSLNESGKNHLAKLKEEWNFLTQTMQLLWKSPTTSY